MEIQVFERYVRFRGVVDGVEVKAILCLSPKNIAASVQQWKMQRNLGVAFNPHSIQICTVIPEGLAMWTSWEPLSPDDDREQPTPLETFTW